MPDPFPSTLEECVGERVRLTNEARSFLEGIKASGREMSADDRQGNNRRMTRVRDLKVEIDRRTAENKAKQGDVGVLLAELDEIESSMDAPLNQRRTTGDGDRIVTNRLSANGLLDYDLPANHRRVAWDLNQRRIGNGQCRQRTIDIGGRRASNEYRAWGRQKLVGNERQILGPDGNPISGRDGQVSNLLTTIQTGVDERAGYFVLPEQMTGEILKTVDDEVWILQWARVTYLKEAKTLGIRRRVAKANSFNWGTEVSDATDNLENALTYGKRVLDPHWITGSFRLSRDLVRMADINIEQEVISEMMIDYSEFLEAAFMTGSGVSRPLGLLTASTNGISTSRDLTYGTTGTTFTFNTLIKAKYTLKAKYKRNAFFVFHPDRVAELAMFRDDSGATTNTGQYLWQPSRIANEPDVVIGVPVRESYFMPSATGTGNYFGIYGDFSYYRIVIALEMEMQMLREMRARTNEYEYLFRSKIDASPVMEEAFLRLTYGS